ncbi:MAG: hypothetical protein IJA34_10710 [Lachnospiraceae bacterium]|nr:hypothetical protein [Lachnospiraceae bacterium]
MQTIDLTNIKKEKIENHTSKGNQPKWHIGNKWYKADHMGYEALAEYMVSQLLKRSNLKNFVSYELVGIKYDGKETIGCVSENFKENYEMLIPLEKLHRQYFGIGLADAIAQSGVNEKIDYTVKFVEEITGLRDVGKYFSFLLAADAFFLNEDRHTNNIAVIRNEKTLEYRFAPIFDNGLALLSDTNDYLFERDIYDNIRKIQAKPFDVSFDVQLDAVEEMYGSYLNFNFTRKDIYEITNNLADIFDEKIIKRVEEILFEQMRKYQYFFN